MCKSENVNQVSVVHWFPRRDEWESMPRWIRADSEQFKLMEGGYLVPLARYEIWQRRRVEEQRRTMEAMRPSAEVLEILVAWIKERLSEAALDSRRMREFGATLGRVIDWIDLWTLDEDVK